MKKVKITIILGISTIFLIMLTLTYYEYRTYSKITNEFVTKIVNLISEEYPNVDTTKIIEIINETNYDDNSNIMLSYGFTASDLSILASFETVFYNQLLLNCIIFIIISLIIVLLFYMSYYKKKREMRNIIKYLNDLNRGNYDLQIDLNDEGEISILKNEIYTTTIMLREQAEKQLKDKKNLKDSLTNISHQLKTPLTSISLMIDNLCDKNVPKQIEQEFLYDIKKQIASINYLIIVLLKISRFDANVVTFKKENINVKKLCIEVIKHLDALREVKNINIHINGLNNTCFVGDYKWEFEAISNIIKNCLEYTLDNKNIYISFSENNVYTEIKITDEGKGMNKEEQKNIFQRFYKGQNSNNDNFGIGMSLAKEIISKDNGNIMVESKVNVGTTFKIRYYK